MAKRTRRHASARALREPSPAPGCVVTDVKLRLNAKAAAVKLRLNAKAAAGGRTPEALRVTGDWSDGFLIRDATQNGSANQQSFHSREKAPDNVPQLVVTSG